MSGKTTMPERKGKKPFDPIGIIRRHWIEIAVFGTILFIVSLPVAYLISRTFYTVQGRILVAPSVSTFIAQTEETPIIGYYNAYVRTHVNRLKQQSNIEKALLKLDPETRARFVPRGTSLPIASSLLLKKIEVDHMGGTHLITLTMTDRKPDGLAEFVNSVIEVYMQEIQKEMDTKDYRRLMYLKNEKEKVEEDLAAQSRLLQEIAGVAGTFSFENENNIYNTQFEALQEEYMKVLSDRVVKENAYNALMGLGRYRQKVSVDPLVNEFVNQSGPNAQVQASTRQEIMNLNSAIAEYPPTHPGRVKIEAKIKALEDNLKLLESTEKKKALGIVSQKRSMELNERILNAKAEFESSIKAEENIKAKRDEILDSRSKISQQLLSGKQISDKIEHLRGLLNRIEDRISELTLESKQSSRLQVESLARTPQIPAGSSLKKIVIAFLVASYGGVLMLCFFFEIISARIRERRDVFHALGAYPSWPISNYAFTGSPDVPFSKVTKADSSNVVAKALQSLALRIDKERKAHDARCVVFTGIGGECGTTEILLNTAFAITRLCKNVLVIDAHFEGPDMIRHLSGDADQTPGIIDFLLGRVTIKDCIYHDDERGIDFILPGRSPSDEDLSLMDFSIIPHMIRELKQRYALILMDCAPVLTSDITEYFILQSDITLTVIQGDKTRYDDLFMAGDILFRLEVPAVAAVLNWGAQRDLSKGRIFVSKLLWPVENFLVRLGLADKRVGRYFLDREKTPIREPKPSGPKGALPGIEEAAAG